MVKLLNQIRESLLKLDGNNAMDELNETGVLKLELDGQTVELANEDLLIDTAQMEGYVSESDQVATIVLDTNLTPELIEEGFVREVISKVQTMRKEADFEVTDKIKIYVKGNAKIEEILSKHKNQLMSEILATDLVLGETAGYEKEWNINGEKVELAVEK